MKISKTLSLPLDLASQTTAVLGIRGSGKTVTASVIAEECLKQNVQVVILDPTDVWWGLKSSASGNNHSSERKTRRTEFSGTIKLSGFDSEIKWIDLSFK